MDDIVDDMDLEAMAWDDSIIREILFEGATEIERLRAALLEISQLEVGLWKTPEYHMFDLTEKFYRAKEIAAQTSQKSDDLV